MRHASASLLPVWVLGSLLSAQSVAPPAKSAPPTSPGTCKVFVTIEPADIARWSRLLATPAVADEHDIATSDDRKMEAWDLPPKITPWRDRLSWSDYVTHFNMLQTQKTHFGRLTSYERATFRHRAVWLSRPLYMTQKAPPPVQAKLHELFASNGPSRFPGVCRDPDRATYLIELASMYIVARNFLALRPPVHRGPPRLINAQTIDFSRPNPDAPPPFDSRGYDAGPASTVDGSLQDAPSGFACVYVYKLPSPTTRRWELWNPDYYYCPYGGSGKLPSAANKVLEFLSKSATP